MSKRNRQIDDTHVKGIVAFAALLIVLIAASFGLVAWLTKTDVSDGSALGAEIGVADDAYGTDGPPLQTDASLELLEVRAREDSLLGLSGRDQVSTRMSISRAIEHVADSLSDESLSSGNRADSPLLLTESGWIRASMGIFRPFSPAYTGPRTTSYAEDPAIVRILDAVDTTSER